MRFLLILFALTFADTPAFACKCAQEAFTPEASRANIEAAHYIFSGRVLDIDKGAEQSPEGGEALRPRENPAYSRMTVSIRKRLKGPNDARNLVIYADTLTSCGAPSEELVKTELFIVREERGDYVLAGPCDYYLTDEDKAALLRGDFKRMKTAQPLKKPMPQTPPAVPVEDVKAEQIAPAPDEAALQEVEAVTNEQPDAPAQATEFEQAPQPETETATQPAPEPEQPVEEAETAPAAQEAGAAPQAAAAPAGTSLAFFKNGAPYEVPAPLAAELAAGLSKTLRACWLYQGERMEEDWDAAVSEGSYIALRYENAAGTVELSGVPGKAFGAHLWIEEAVFPAHKGGQAIDAPLVRSGGAIHVLGKCDSAFLLTVQCRPELADFFEDSYKKGCHIVEKWNLKK